MKNKCRVVITGLGALTPLGLDVSSLWKGLCEGRSGISRITRFDASDLPVQIGGEVKGFDPCGRLDPKLVRRTARFTQYALCAALEATDDAVLDFGKLDKDRVGVIVGTSMGGIETMMDEHRRYLSAGPSRVSSRLMPAMLPDMACGQISICFGVRGPNYCTTSACSSGAHAICFAVQHIMRGDADVMIAGGTEAALTHFMVAGLANMRALSRRNQEPERASRPFDVDRDGFVISEGAGIVILEELGHAERRNAKIYAEFAGCACNSDAYHISAPDPEGSGAYFAMKEALEASRLPPDSITYINAHGTSTKLNDVVETRAIRRLFVEHADKIAVNSSKSMIGHLQGAGGAVEFLVTSLSVCHQKVHPTTNLEHPDPECDLDYVPEGARDLEITAALTNSFAFGGHNVTLIVKRFEG